VFSLVRSSIIYLTKPRIQKTLISKRDQEMDRAVASSRMQGKSSKGRRKNKRRRRIRKESKKKKIVSEVKLSSKFRLHMRYPE
jgi:hypothetical protein